MLRILVFMGISGRSEIRGTPAAKRAGVIEKLFNNDNYAMSKAMLDVSAARHQALAANIANVETPAYRRVDVSKSFMQELQSQFKDGKVTGSIEKPMTETDTTARSVRADGNTVEIDNELLQMGSNEMQYETLTEFVSNNLAQLKAAITGRSL